MTMRLVRHVLLLCSLMMCSKLAASSFGHPGEYLSAFDTENSISEATPQESEQEDVREWDEDAQERATGAGGYWERHDPNAAFSNDPNAVLGAFKVAPGYEVNLFASEPMIENPIQMAWDTWGRLWVICAPTYPQLIPGQATSDYIAVLEDTNNDGKADKRTVFADGLLVPTGIELGDGGVYVANAPDLLFLADTDGDLKADVRRTVLTGFGTEDNHHAISAFVWSPGGNLHFQSGIFLHSQIETPYGVVSADDAVIFEFNPRKTRLRRYVYGSGVNPWGHNFDRWGQDFQTDGAWEGIWWLAPGQIPAHARERVPATARIDASSAGSEILSGRHLPDDMQGVLALNDFRKRTVSRHRFSDNGAGFTTKEISPPLLVSTEEYFRPVDVEMGPDGAIYILDWHNALIGHMQYSFRDPRRDHGHGRVWRITAKDRPLVAKPKIGDASIGQLLSNLRAPEDYTRHKSRRELCERDALTVADALATWAAALDVNDGNYELSRLEALWTYQSIKVVAPGLLRKVLRAEEPKARAAATRVLRYWRDKIPNVLELLEIQVGDAHPRVRLEAVVALSHMTDIRAMEIAAKALDSPMDGHLEYALALTANALESVWIPAYEAGELLFGGNPAHSAFALESLHSEGAVKPLLDLLRGGQVPSSRRAAIVTRIIDEGTPDALSEVFRLTYDQLERYDPSEVAQILASYVRAARDRGVIPSSEEGFSMWNTSNVISLADHHDDGVRSEAIRLMGAWNLRRGRGRLQELARAGSVIEQKAAIEGLAYLGGEESIAFLQELAADGNAESLRVASVGGLALLDLRLAADSAVDVLASRRDLNPIPVLEPFLEINGGAEALGGALDKVEIPEDVAKLAMRHMNAVGRQEPVLVDVLLKWAKIFVPAAELTTDQIGALVRDVENQGDAARGEAIFRRAELTCFNCHAIMGGGSNLAPDLNALGTSSPLDYIIEAILTPNKTIKEDYEAVLITTKTGMFHAGIIQDRNEDAITLRDALRDNIVIPSALVAEIRETSSLMPSGLTAPLTREELLDLARFLSELGKPGAFEVRSASLARRWRVLYALPEGHRGMGMEERDALVLENESLLWLPAYSMVSGLLPVDALAPTGGRAVAYARTQVEVLAAGSLALHLNSSDALALWVDADRVPIADRIGKIELNPGVHTLTFRIDLAARGDVGLSVEFGDEGETSARFQVVNGR